MGRILWPHLLVVLTVWPAASARADSASSHLRMPVAEAAPDAAPALSCPQPILAPGQEAQVVRLFAPPANLPAVRADAIVIAGGRIAGTWLVQGKSLERRVYLLTPRTDKTGEPGLLTKKFRIQLALPCWTYGPVAAVDEPTLRGLQLAAAATATCQAQPELDQALQLAVLASEDAVQLSCPATAARAADVAKLLGDFAATSQVGDREAGQKLLHALENLDASHLDLATRFDLGLALVRHGRRELGDKTLRPALSEWRGQTSGGATDLAQRQTAVHTAERAAAAAAWLESPQKAEQVLRDCWQRYPESSEGSGSCLAMPLSDALLASGHGTLAAAILDEQLKRTAKPPTTWFSAGISLASRQDDSRVELAIANAAVQAWPDDLALHDALATACFRAGEHLKAVRELEGIFKKNPDYQGVLGRLSGIVDDWGRVDPPREGQTSGWQQLRDEMRARAAKDSSDTVAQFLFGVSLFDEGKFEQALVQMKLVEPRVKNEGRVYTYQALVQLWLGHPDEAQKLADKAVLANPRDPDVYYCQSQALRQHDKLAAAAMLQRYLDVEGQSGALHFSNKAKRVQAEMALLKKGELPPLWVKSGHDDDGEPDRPAGLPGQASVTAGRGNRSLNPPWQTWLWVGALAALVIGGGTWLTRNSK